MMGFGLVPEFVVSYDALPRPQVTKGCLLMRYVSFAGERSHRGSKLDFSISDAELRSLATSYTIILAV